MTVAEALKQSKSRGLFHGKLIAYAQSQLTPQEDLLCAAIVMLTKMQLGGEHKLKYLNRMESSSKIKMLLCVTTKRLVFFNYMFGSAITYELPLAQNPRLDATQSKKGVGVGGLKLLTPEATYYIAGNRKLTNYLKSGILAAFMVYQDQLKAAAQTDKPAQQPDAE